MSTYVYGITHAAHASLVRDLDGVGDPPRPVLVLREGELAAIVSDAPEELRPKRRELLAHQRVLDAVGEGGVVLPIRFASVSPTDETVTAVLAERADHLLERLQALDGTAEYNLKANHNEEAVLQLVVADNDEIRSLAEANRQAGGGSQKDKVRLGEMIAVALQAREAADAEMLQRELSPAAGAVSAAPSSTGWLANLSFLIDRTSAGGFLDAVDQLRQQHPHLELRVNGPLPPYSFVDEGSEHAEGTAAAFEAAAEPNNG
ncbi:GvpL/GvpF family gas vesicle protein [Streptomyces sp. NPDC002766]|uniref:GvpL/GvpF family gas vesicle protein n=1 Tax=Streptomyces sp. NPDC002766 TaxID=3154429 RepID=UPI0033207682